MILSPMATKTLALLLPKSEEVAEGVAEASLDAAASPLSLDESPSLHPRKSVGINSIASTKDDGDEKKDRGTNRFMKPSIP